MCIKKIIYKTFLLLFLCVFFIVWGKVLFGDVIYKYNTIILILYMSAGIGVILAVYKFIARRAAIIKKHYKSILAVFLTLYGIIILINSFLLRFTPAFDMDAVYSGAVQWVKQGSFPDYYEYFGYFPNNIGAMVVLHTIFSIVSVFGISDFFAVGAVFNSLLITATVMVVSLVCRKLKGEAAGVMALVFFMVYIPFMFMGAAFYTDSLSLLFPVLFYYLYIYFKEQVTWKKRALFASGMALVLTIGMLIKFTVVIILFAVIIDALLTIGWKEVCLLTGFSLLLAFVSFNIMDLYMYSKHLDKNTSKQLNTPYLHWVMMGLQNNGAYSYEDYEYTRSFAAEDRNKACLSKIKERINNMGFAGFTELLLNKADVCFGDGTLSISDFLDDSPYKYRWIHQYILYSGAKHYQYKHFVTGILLGIYLFMLRWAAICLKGKNTSKDIVLAPVLAGLGILAFLLLWETRGRYFTNFVPVLLVCATMSFNWEKQ